MVSQDWRWNISKWYGNIEDIVNLENDGATIKATVPNYRLRDPIYYMREAITWTEVAGGHFSCRYVPSGVLFGNGGPVCFFQKNLHYTLGLLNSKVANSFLQAIAPTLNFGPEQINRVPFCSIRNAKSETLCAQILQYPNQTGIPLKLHGILSNIRLPSTNIVFQRSMLPIAGILRTHLMRGSINVSLDSMRSRATKKNSIVSLLTFTACRTS